MEVKIINLDSNQNYPRRPSRDEPARILQYWPVLQYRGRLKLQSRFAYLYVFHLRWSFDSNFGSNVMSWFRFIIFFVICLDNIQSFCFAMLLKGIVDYHLVLDRHILYGSNSILNKFRKLFSGHYQKKWPFLGCMSMFACDFWVLLIRWNLFSFSVTHNPSTKLIAFLCKLRERYRGRYNKGWAEAGAASTRTFS